MNAPSEIWMPVQIAGLSGQYEVSNLGNVRSLDRIVAVRGQSPRFRKGQPIKPSIAKDHYKTVILGGLTCAVHKAEWNYNDFENAPFNDKHGICYRMEGKAAAA